MHRFRLVRSFGFRVATAYVALFSASVLALFSIVYLATVDSIKGQVEDEIRAELSALDAERLAEGGRHVASEIARRVREDRSAHLLLQDATGRLIAGNLPPIQPENGWIDLPPPADPVTGRKHSEHIVHGKGRILENGDFLFVGRDLHPLRQLREIIVHGFLACGIATIAIALGLGALSSAMVMRRFRAISLATGEIARGNFSRRLPITDRGDEFDELSAHVNTMLSRIQSLIEDLQQVSNDIAHDLRTPLTRLRQQLELALVRDAGAHAGGGNAVRAIEKAIGEADVLLATFAAMLRIAQIDSGSRRSGFAPVDLSRLLDSLVETYAPVAEDGHHWFGDAIVPGVIVYGDAELLTQMFANLIENAIQHTPPGSQIEVRLDRADGLAVAVVADDGPGIPENMRERVCKRFVRLESSRTTVGSGLGLSLVAAVAQLHEIALDIGDNAPGLRVSLTFRAPTAFSAPPASDDVVPRSASLPDL